MNVGLRFGVARVFDEWFALERAHRYLVGGNVRLRATAPFGGGFSFKVVLSIEIEGVVALLKF